MLAIFTCGLVNKTWVSFVLVLSALVRLTKETPKKLMKLTKKETKEENRLKIKQLEHNRSKRRHETNTKKRGRWSAVGLEKNGLRNLWIVENMFLSFLESKILLWKVNFHIYFPQWQVMSKVSVKPWNDVWETSAKNSILMARQYLDLGGSSDWLNQVSHAAWAIRSTTQIWVATHP